MDMTLTLEGFDYKFGPAECGAFIECGNATFESYQRARDLAIVLFILALVVVAIKDMLRGGLGDVDLGAVDTKTLPEMLKYSILVFAFLFIFPPVWDTAAGLMNNVGIWILNPLYDLGYKGEYKHGERGDMCVGPISYDDVAGLAPYVRDRDAWAIYRNGDTSPTRDGNPSMYGVADNYIIDADQTLDIACLDDGADASCPAAWDASAAPPGYEIGDVLCSPDLRVKYVFGQALAVVETESVNPEQVLGAVSGTGGDDILVAILTQFLKSSVTLQIIMVVFMTGVMVDVVTAFALSILPIVFFYRFLPMSGKVRLGDYSGAAFALLAMPLVASLVLVAGSGTVAGMAAEDDDEEFASFFVWLAALSVVLLVIAIPATMVPLVGSAQMQATAALQTGVQTAQFAATAVAASAGGAIRGWRGGAEYSRLASMAPHAMTAAQSVRLGQLEKAGHGQMSAARAALQGGMGGLRGQIYDEAGRPTKQFTNTVMPGTGPVTAASVKGLGGFEAGDATSTMGGLSGAMGAVAASTLGAARGTGKGKPTQKELLDAANKTKAETKQELDMASTRIQKAKAEAEDTEGYTEYAAAMLKAERLRDGERTNMESSKKSIINLEENRIPAEAKLHDMQRERDSLKSEMARADDTHREEMQKDMDKLNEKITKTNDSIDGMIKGIEDATHEVERATKALEFHDKVAEYHLYELAGAAAGGAVTGRLAEVVIERQMAVDNHADMVRAHNKAISEHNTLQKEFEGGDEPTNKPKYDL